MSKWPYEVKHTPMTDVLRLVKCEKWQAFRLSLKGLTTEQKLYKLVERRQQAKRDNGGILPYAEQIRIDNYINALKRGGQLNGHLEIVK